MSDNLQPVNGGRSKFLHFVVEIVKFVWPIILIVVLVRGSLFEPYQIPSSSMESTLLIGDRIIVSKITYGLRLPFIQKTLYRYDTPKRGEVVVFTKPEDPDTNIIKRVIGLPGDTVEVKGTQVFINGEYYAEDLKYARWISGGVKDFGPIKVPEERVFLMGDNRDASRDSRFWDDPFLPIDNIKGRALLIFFNGNLDLNRMFVSIR